MKWIKYLLDRAATFFARPETKQAITRLADLVPHMLPYVIAGGDFIAGITPSTLDDIALAFLRKSFPRLFDGSIKQADELKRYTGTAIATLFADRFGLKENQARAILELAVLARKLDGGP